MEKNNNIKSKWQDIVLKDRQEKLIYELKQEILSSLSNNIEKLIERTLEEKLNGLNDTDARNSNVTESRSGDSQVNLHEDFTSIIPHGVLETYTDKNDRSDFIISDVNGNNYVVEIKSKIEKKPKHPVLFQNTTKRSEEFPYFVVMENVDNINFEREKGKKYNFDEYHLFCNVKQILDDRGLKQSWLQQKTQIPSSTLWSILNNEKAVSLENAMRISMVMDLPISTLFSYLSVDDVIQNNSL